MFVLLYMSYMCERARASPRAGIWGSGARRVSAIRRVWFRAYLVIPDDLGCGGSGGPKCPLFAVAVQEDQATVFGKSNLLVLREQDCRSLRELQLLGLPKVRAIQRFSRGNMSRFVMVVSESPIESFSFLKEHNLKVGKKVHE